jgi:membrane fusion protein, copper/silver efflux system
MSTNLLHNAFIVTKVALARLRFLAVFLAMALLVGYWDNIKNHIDKWTRPPANSAELLQPASDIEYYCAMHPNVIRTEPGHCPICGMPLIKRKKGEKVELPPAVLSRIQLTPQRIALANIQTFTVEPRDLVREIRAVATLDYDETRVAQISSRVAGRADELYVKSVGAKVSPGDRLYSIYSPDVFTAQREYLLARKRVNDLPKDAADDLKMDSVELYNASMQKLALWGATDKDFDRIDQEFDKTAKVPTHFVVTSPIAGIVVKRSLFEGGYVQTGDTPYIVADMSNLWLQVRIYENDVPFIKLGAPVQVHIDSVPNESFAGKITFLAYQLDPATRTLAARVELANPNLRLRPGMFADVLIHVPVLPETAATTTAPAVPSAELDRATAFRAALDPYFAAHDALADAQEKDVSTNLHLMLARLAAIKFEAPQKTALDSLAQFVHATSDQKIEALRDSFREISSILIDLGKSAGIPSTSSSVKIFRCPMGKKPNWLQLGTETINPYYPDPKMRDCGDSIDALPKIAAPIATLPATPGTHILAIPRSAVIDTGHNKVVFVANLAKGEFDLHAVTVGPLAGDYYPVLAGLEEGDRVVTSGAFLLDSENRLNPTATNEPTTQAATTTAPTTQQ